MKNTIIISLLALSFLMFSCNPNEIYREYQTTPGLVWEKTQSPEFKVNVEDVSIPYNLHIAYRYAEGMENAAVNMVIDISGPDGFQESREVSVRIKDDSGDYVGEPAMEIWDTEELVVDGMTLPSSGEYTVKITHAMETSKVYYTMEVGLIVEKKAA